MTQDEMNNRFSYHTPKADQPDKYQKFRAKAKELAELYEELAPESREKALAFTELESSVMWINAAVARRS